MTTFTDEPLAHGVRKRATYRTSERARLVLSIPRADGGTLQLPVESNMRSHQEEPEIQQNTFLTIVPMGRLPGRESYNESPRGAMLRAGRLYIFWRNRLWRELESDGQGGFLDVDVAHWREQAAAQKIADERPPVSIEQHSLVLPAMVQGAYVADQVYLAYSEMPWPWRYIEWLEARPERIDARAQTLVPAWAAAVVDPQQWQPSQAAPAFQIDRNVRGLCARDLHLETLLEDPYLLSPNLGELPPACLLNTLAQRQQELAAHTGEPAPDSPPSIDGFTDLLTDYKLRGHPKLVGLMLDDPLFALRHAVAQSRLAAELLQVLNALVPYQSHGHYADLLYQGASAPDAPLRSFADHIDWQALRATNLHNERKSLRDYLALQQRRVLALLRHQVAQLYSDWRFSTDELLAEPYAVLVEMLEVLNRTPEDCDPRCVDQPDAELAAQTLAQAKRLIDGTDPITRDLFPANEADQPEIIQALRALSDNQRSADPARMGLSTLATLSFSPAGQSFSAALDELVNHLAVASASVVKRLGNSPGVTQVELHRHFVPTLNLANRLHSQAAGLRILPQGEALAKNRVVLGVHGGGVSFGLTAAERGTLTRQNYLYANLETRSGGTLATSSGKAAERMGFASRELGRVMVVTAQANDPLVEEFRQWRHGVGNQQALNALSKSTVLPGIAAACAVVSLYANVAGSNEFMRNQDDTRMYIGLGIATVDLGIASNNIALKILADNANKSTWYIYWEKGRFQTRGFWAENLIKRTGSHWLNWSRIGSTAALGLNTALFAWDAGRAFKRGDDDVALANLIAMSGAGLWAVYTIGLLASPWALAIGLALVVGGALGAAFLADGAVEQAIKHGPFGTKPRLPHMEDPLIAYQQLLGSLGQPQVRIQRLADWVMSAPAQDKQWVEDAESEAGIQLSAEDWAVEFHCPLLSQFRDGKDIQIVAREAQRTRTYGSGWDNRHQHIPQTRLGAVMLDASRLLFVLPSAFSVPQVSDPRRYRQAFEYRLRVFAQFQLGDRVCRADDTFPGYGHITLPQPEPRQWQPPSPGQRPTDSDTVFPYWVIEHSEFIKS